MPKRKYKAITWRKDRDGDYIPSRGASNPDFRCFISPDSKGFRAVDKFYGESKYFYDLALAKRWLEKHIEARE